MSLATLEAKKRQVLDRLDIVQVVSEHVALKRNGKRWVGLCCFHNEKTASFNVNPDLGIFKCFGCGKAGDIFTFIQLRENVGFREAFEMLADKAGVSLGERTSASSSAGEVSRADMAAANAWAATFFRKCLLHEPMGRAARDYVRQRGISDACAEQFGMGLAPESGASIVQPAGKAGFNMPVLIAADLCRVGEDGQVYETFRNRLMFPIRDATGRTIGFGGRTLADHPAKYLNTRQTALFDKGRGLYGLAQARDSIGKMGRAIIVEGYTDCIACHQFGFSETVATLGTAMTEDHVNLLRRFTDDVVLLFDSDQAGISAAERAISVALPHGLRVRLSRVPDGKDPSEFLTRHGAEAFQQVLNGAVEALEFKWFETCRRMDADSSNARRREAVVEFLGVVGAAQRGGAVDAVHRGLIVNQIAHLIGTDAAEVRLLLQKQTAPPKARGSGHAEGREASPQAEQATVRSGGQRAWAHMLGVLLNEPGLWRTVEVPPTVDMIEDERDRRLANLVLGVLGETSDFSLSEVLARVHDASDVARLSDLAYEGLQRGNYGDTLRFALHRIRGAEQDAVVERSRLVLREQHCNDSGTGKNQEHLATVSNGVRNHRHFAPRRMIRLTVNAPPSDVVDPRRTNANE